jgi:hypothetical protein
VAIKQRTPPAITKPSCMNGGPNNVGEQHSREHTIGLARLPMPGQKLLDLR